jgi:hypothetical protein
MLGAKTKQDAKEQVYKVNIEFSRASVSHKDLLNHFSKFGKILKVYLPPKNEKDDAHIVCADKISFARILKKPEHIVNGAKVICSPRDSSDEYSKLKQELEDKYRILNQDKIHIRGIHRRTNDGSLRSARNFERVFPEVRRNILLQDSLQTRPAR